MHVRVNLPQQATSRTAQGTAERQERPERPEQPERPERPERTEMPERPERSESPDVVAGRAARDELRELARAQREAAADIRRAAEEQANRVIVRNGVPVPAAPPVPPVPGIQVHTEGGEDMIPPQVVDLAYGFYAMVALMVIGWPLARAWGRRLERGTTTASLSPAMGEQLQRIEHAVDTMALEVERISEAQRYLTKLQAGHLVESGLPTSENR